MKGVIFVKFNEFVEELWGDEFWDEILNVAVLASKGIYTTVGTYDDQELFTLIDLVVEKQDISSKDVQFAFGKWVFKELYEAAPEGLHVFTDVFEFLHAVQDFIHVEVKKLNPTAIHPEFEFLSETPTLLSFHYLSPRKLCFFCEGIVYGLAQHTGQSIRVSQSECEHQGDERCVLVVEKV
jgi:predicted hydrocarbon binding protein